MKLKYEFASMEIDGQYVAVAVGEDADKFNGMLRVNESAQEILNLLQHEDTTEEAICAKLREIYQDEGNLADTVHAFIERLEAENLLVH